MLRRQFHEIGLNSQLEELALLTESHQGVEADHQTGQAVTSDTSSVEELEIVYRSQATDRPDPKESNPHSQDEPTTASSTPALDSMAPLNTPIDADLEYHSFDEATELSSTTSAANAAIWSPLQISPSGSSSNQTSLPTPTANPTTDIETNNLSEATLIQAAMFLNYTVYGEDKIRSYYTGNDDNGYDDNYIQYLETATFGAWEVLTATNLGSHFFDSDHYFEHGGLYVGKPLDFRDNSAEALVVEAEVDGQNALILSFRGTDGLIDQGFLEAQTWTGLGAINYYMALQPIINATLEYASLNGISKIIVTGHSLGGTMADIFAATDAERFVNAGLDLSVVSFATAGMDPTLPRYLALVEPDLYDSVTNLGLGYITIPGTGIKIPAPILTGVNEPTAFQHLSINNENDPVPYPPAGLLLGENIDFDVDYSFTTPNQNGALGQDTHYSFVYWASIQGIFGDRLFNLHTDHEIIVGNANYNNLTTLFGVPINLIPNPEDSEDDDSRGRALVGASTNDYILGLSGNDHIYGNEGNDLLSGGEGRDYIEGGANSDTLDGGSGRDELFGGSGNDVLSTSGEGDLLSGGGGSDIFSFDFEFGYVGNSASILDFEDGIDLIDLSAFEGLRYSDLAITEVELTAQVTVGGTGGQISVLGVSASNLTAEDFIFATSVLTGTYTFVLTEPNSLLGYSVTSAGDIDADGLADVLIGAPGLGLAYVIASRDLAAADALDGSVDGVIQVSRVSTLGSNSYGFIGGGGDAGSLVSSAGDFDGDGLDDLFIGAPHYSDISGTNVGEAYLIGSTSMSLADEQIDLFDDNVIPLVRSPSIPSYYSFYGGDEFSYVGGSFTFLGDLDGDGFDEFALGRGPTPSMAFIISAADLPGLDIQDGISNGAIDVEDISSYEGTYSIKGSVTWGHNHELTLANAGDVNGDGKNDLLLTLTANDEFLFDVFLLASSEFDEADAADGTIDGVIQTDCIESQADSYRIFGLGNYVETVPPKVASAGDVDGDGLSDFIIGDEFSGDDYAYGAGSAWLLLARNMDAADGDHDGSIDIQEVQLQSGNYRFYSEIEGRGVGASVASAGDFDGGGADLLIAAPATYGQPEDGVGRVYLISSNQFEAADALDGNVDGAVNLDLVDGFTGVYQFRAASGWGTDLPVSSAGDVDGDGLSDFLIGAPGVAEAFLISARDLDTLDAKDGSRDGIIDLVSLHGLVEDFTL